MGKWVVEYWSDESGKRSVERWLLKLTREQFKFVSKELKLLEICVDTPTAEAEGFLSGSRKIRFRYP